MQPETIIELQRRIKELEQALGEESDPNIRDILQGEIYECLDQIQRREDYNNRYKEIKGL